MKNLPKTILRTNDNISTYVFFLSYVLMYMIIFEIKKNLIVLFHKYPDEMAKYYTRPIFSNGFDHANLVTSFRDSKYLPKI